VVNRPAASGSASTYRPHPFVTPNRHGGSAQHRLHGRTREIFPEDLQDSAFDRYANLPEIMKAFDQFNASALTDTALEVAEGERILERPRKGINAHELLQRAAELASSQHDKEALARLRKEAERRGDKDLANRIAAQERLASAPRAAEPALVVDVEHTRPEAVAQLQSYLRTLKFARLLGDRRLLNGLTENLPRANLLTQEQRNYLKKQIEETSSALPKTPSADTRSLRELLLGPDKPVDETAKNKGKLSAASRDLKPARSAQPGRVFTLAGQEDLASYGALTFQLEPGGRALMFDHDGTEVGTWSANGPQYQLTFYNGTVVYTGTRQGNTLSGTAANGRTTWNWSVQPVTNGQAQPAPGAPAPEGP
jgi:hypothetical protein